MYIVKKGANLLTCQGRCVILGPGNKRERPAKPGAEMHDEANQDTHEDEAPIIVPSHSPLPPPPVVNYTRPITRPAALRGTSLFRLRTSIVR